jgi:hypothetical protein
LDFTLLQSRSMNTLSIHRPLPSMLILMLWLSRQQRVAGTVAGADMASWEQDMVA